MKSMKRKIIIWTLVIVISLSSVAAAVILLNNTQTPVIDVAQGDVTTSPGSPQDTGDIAGDQETGTGNEGQGAGQDDGDADDADPDDGDPDDGDPDDAEPDDGDQGDDATDEYCTVRFVTNGGDSVKACRVKKGETLVSVPVTQKDDALFDGWYNDLALTEQFYQSEPINEDITLYAMYDELEKQQSQLYEKYTLPDQQPDLAFTIHGEQNLTSAQVLDMISLEIADGSKYILLTATDSNPYTVCAEGGFTPGATYVMTLGDGLSFDGQPDSCRECSFSIHKDEVMNLSVSDSLIYIDADDDVDDIAVDGESVGKLSSALFGDDNDPIQGTFTYNGDLDLSSVTGSVVCVYTGTPPNERDLDGDYTGQDIAYIKITGVAGDTISFESITEGDAEQVLFMPDTFPFDVNDFPESEFLDYEFDFTFDPAYFSEFADMGIDADTTVDPGDFIALYDNDDPDFVDYFEIDTVTPNGGSLHVTFVDITLDAILQAMEYYTNNSRSGNEMLENVDVGKLEKQIETQVMESGFARQTMDYLAAASAKTDGFKEVSGVEDIILTNENGNPLSSDEIELWQHGITVTSNGITVTATISNEPDHFSKGVQVALQISGTYTAKVGDSGEITIEISATLVQEVSIGFGVSGSVEWGWYAFIPYIKEVTMAAYVDIYDFTGISIEVKIQTHEADDSLNYVDITEQLKGLLDIVDPDELDAGVEDLFEKYCEMLKADTDYIEIFNKSVFNQEGSVDPLHIIAYSIEVNFKIYADINIMLGANMEYMSGTRYIFWFKVVAGKAGSSTVDLIPETFQFQFYVMGKLGLKVGLEFKFAVGLFSTHLDSIGLSAEVGPYLELYGYFIYEYSMVRAVGAKSATVTEDMMGALYIEFGIYFESYFNASALDDDDFSYSYPLYEDEWPLLTAGVQGHVYDFANDIGKDEKYVIRNNTTDTLPSSYRNMAVLDLKAGELYQAVYPLDKYNYRVSNPNFAFNPETGGITVTVPDGVQYMTCDLTLTWKADKLTFRKNDLCSTVHLAWTNLSNKELEEKFEVSVKVGGKTVWSDRIYKNSLFDLPSEDAIKELIGYYNETAKIGEETVNLRYDDSGYKGYRYISGLEQRVFKDTVYYFDVTEREYTITIDDVQYANSVDSQEFTAGYNEEFDFDALEGTGTNDSGSGTYTVYAYIETSNGDKQATDAVGREFAIQLLEGTATYEAIYADNSCEVTYEFVTGRDPDVDISIESRVVTVAKGTSPGYDYSGYLDELSPSYMVVEWNNGISPGKVTGDTTFTAQCKVAQDVPKHWVFFEENGGSIVLDCQRYEGGPINDLNIRTSVKPGYTFDYWCTDAGLSMQYDFDTMPKEDLTLYAKWTPNTYDATFNPGTENSVSPVKKDVIYDSTYGALPTPTYNTNQYYFLGWYPYQDNDYDTDPEHPEDEITSSTAMVRTGNHTLYAHYRHLKQIAASGILVNDEKPNMPYCGSPYAYTIAFASGYDGPTSGFTFQFRKINYVDSEYTGSAINGGDYQVKVIRQKDEYYQSFESTSTGDVFTITKIDRGVLPAAPTLDPDHPMTFSSITVNPVDVPNGDGIIEYGVTSDNTMPTTWTTSCTISGLAPGGHYRILSRVKGGDNYNDAYCNIDNTIDVWTPARLTPSYNIKFRITTGDDPDESGEGTDAVVTLRLQYADGYHRDYEMDSGYSFETGSQDDLEITTSYSPWMIESISLMQNGDGAGDEWYVSTVKMYIMCPDGVNAWADHIRTFTFNTWFEEDDWKTRSVSPTYRRYVSAIDSMWSSAESIDQNSTGYITKTTNGHVTDQFSHFYGNESYNYMDAQHISLELADTSKEDIYGDCFYYSNYEFVIDKKKLYDAMCVTGDTTVTFNILIVFPARSIAQYEDYFTQTVTITRD